MTQVTSRKDAGHGRFSPSQSERFINCPGSRALIDRTPARGTSSYAEEGVIAHAILETALKNGVDKVSEAIKLSEYKDHELCKNYSDFHASIQDAIDHILYVVEDLDLLYGDAVLGVEAYVDTPSAKAPGETGGFVDCYVYSESGRILHVMDYKHGVGVAKAAEGNSQVMQYAAGLLFEPSARITPTDFDEVHVTIIQPRAFHKDGDIRTSVVSVEDVYNYLHVMDSAVEASLQPDAPLNPGISWCQFCPARTACPALANSTLSDVLGREVTNLRDVKQDTLPDVQGLDVERMAYILDMKPMLQLWLKAVEDHADELTRAGIQIPGYKRVLAQARRRYEGDRDELALKISQLIGCHPHDLYREPELLTITDMEKKVIEAFKDRVGRGRKKKAAEDAAKMFAFFTTKESSGNTTLVPLSDKRPAVNISEQTFGAVSALIPATSNEKEN